MRTKISILLLSISVVFLTVRISFLNSSMAQNNEHNRLPVFEDYLVGGDHGKQGNIIGIDRWREEDPPGSYEKRIRKAAKTGANFAGHYAIIGSSCGMICLNLSIVDSKTGKIYGTPFIGIGDGPCPKSYYKERPRLVDFRTDSRLLILHGAAEESESKGTFHDAKCSTRYYEWANNRLVLIREIFYE